MLNNLPWKWTKIILLFPRLHPSTAFQTFLLTMKAVAAAAKSLQSCLTLCDPIDGSPPGSAVPGILQAKTLEWVAISFSNAWKLKGKVKSLSHVRLFVTPWTAAHQAPPSMGFSRQEDWSGVPLPSPLLYEESINQCYWLYQSLHFPFQRELFSIIFQNLVTIH